MQIKKLQSDDRFNMKSKSRIFRIVLFMVLELYTSVLCFGIKLITKNTALFQVLVILNQKMVPT